MGKSGGRVGRRREGEGKREGKGSYGEKGKERGKKRDRGGLAGAGKWRIARYSLHWAVAGPKRRGYTQGGKRTHTLGHRITLCVGTRQERKKKENKKEEKEKEREDNEMEDTYTKRETCYR